MYKKVPVDESVEDRAARIEEDKEANAQIIAMFCRDGRNNTTAITLITAHYSRQDKDLNANNLFNIYVERKIHSESKTKIAGVVCFIQCFRSKNSNQRAADKILGPVHRFIDGDRKY